MRFRIRLAAAVLPLCLATLLPALLTAQDRWRLLDADLASGFSSELEWPRSGAELFFRDVTTGYYYTFREGGSDQRIYYRTSDGGETWTELDEPIPIPHKLLTAQFGYSPTGFITTNGGTSWQPIAPDFDDPKAIPDPELNYEVVEAVAFNSQSIVVLYRQYDLEEVTGDSALFGPNRIAWTLDGGANWEYGDTVEYFRKDLQFFQDSTWFGFLQAPGTMTDTIEINWTNILAMPNDSIVYVQTRAFGKVGTGRETHYYLGALNLKSGTAAWKKIPVVVPLLPPPAGDLQVRFITDRVAYALQGERSMDDPNEVTWTIWRTENVGNDWESFTVPDWVDVPTLRFVSETKAVALNAFSEDGGETWTRWAHPFGSGMIFYPIDNDNYVLAGRFSLFARTDDGGETWRRNEAGGIPFDVQVFGDEVLVGRGYQSIAMSPDSGETWRDLGAEGKLPPRISNVLGVARPDTLDAPNRIVALATFTQFDGTQEVATISSDDDGETWNVGESLPTLQGIGSAHLLFVPPTEEGGIVTGFIGSLEGLMASTDLGATWSVVDDLPIQRIAMFDPNIGIAMTEEGLFRTDDGGRAWSLEESYGLGNDIAMGAAAFDLATFRALTADKSATYRNWSVYGTDDSDVWSVQEGTGASRPLNVEAFWTDTANVYVVGRGATIQYSSNGGRAFGLERDSVDEFSVLGGYVAAGIGSEYLYVVGPGNSFGRFRLYTTPPANDVPVAGAGSLESSLVLDRNLESAALLYALESRSDVAIRLYDVTGRLLSQVFDGMEEGGNHRHTIDLGSLPTGRYTVTVTADGRFAALPLVVVR